MVDFHIITIIIVVLHSSHPRWTSTKQEINWAAAWDFLKFDIFTSVD